MDAKTLVDTAYSMPLCRPAYARSGSRMLNRETLAIRYRTEPEAARRWVPEPLKMVDPVVTFEVGNQGIRLVGLEKESATSDNHSHMT